MENHSLKTLLPSILPAFIVLVALGGLLYYEFRQINYLTENVGVLKENLASTTAALAENTNTLSQNITELRSQALGLSTSLSSTQQNIDAVKNQVGGVEQTVGSISGTVSTLEKLSKTDQELLKKYSKVYFLNENYVPAHLTDIPKDYLYSSLRSERFMSEAWPYLNSMLVSAKASGVELYVKSAFRSFGEQQTLKSVYSVVYGADTANSFSADQGYSEHQLGTAVDFVSTGMGGKLDGFEKTKAYEWLLSNAHRFGFELSYPSGNDYYVFEPWHWRFVGVRLATHLSNSGLKFYDMDQRDIDKYLANIFD
jgi:LAS superfamily LD-carboxypeptidase LdcB